MLNQSLIHYSPPNRSGHIRKAITAGVKTKGAPMIFHYYDQEKRAPEVEAFAQEDEELIRYNRENSLWFQLSAKAARLQAINVPLCYTRAFASYAVKCLTVPAIPNNAGMLAPLRVSAPLLRPPISSPPAHHA